MNFIKKQINNSITKIKLLDALKQMRNDLEQLGLVPTGREVYDYALRFFSIIVNFQDNYNIDTKLLHDTQEDAKYLVEYINITGRRFDGFVRAKPGEPVTSENIYIGAPKYSISPKALSFFKEYKDTRIQNIIQDRLTNYIRACRSQMLASLTRIVKFNKKPNNFIIRRVLEKQNTK